MAPWTTKMGFEIFDALVIGAFEIALGSVYATDTIAERFRSEYQVVVRHRDLR